jgi:hypothetical protein
MAEEAVDGVNHGGQPGARRIDAIPMGGIARDLRPIIHHPAHLQGNGFLHRNSGRIVDVVI